MIKVIISRNRQRKKSAEHLERYWRAGRSGSTTVEGCSQSDVSRRKWIAALADDDYPPVSNIMMAQVSRFPGQFRVRNKAVGETPVETPRNPWKKVEEPQCIPRAESTSTRAQETHRKAKGHGRWWWYETKRTRSARTESLSDRKRISAGSQNGSELNFRPSPRV
jgi:hypothetical protein